MTEVQIETPAPILADLNFGPFIPEVLPPDHLPPGIPIPCPEVAKILQHAGGDSIVNRVGLRYLRMNGGEIVFPVCLTGDGDMPIFSSLSREEFIKRYRYVPQERFVEALRGYAHTAALITGGADSGLETARMLQAVAIYNYSKPADRKRLDNVLQRDFGLPNLPGVYAKKLAFLDEAIAADDQGRRALNFFSETGMTPVEAARDIVIRNPGLFLGYLIRTITLWPRVAQVQNLGPVVDQLEHTVGNAMEANLGQLLFRNDFVYTDISTALSLLGDLETTLRYPRLYELADRVLTDDFGISREIRHNSRYLSTLFNRHLVDRGIVGEEDLDNGDITTRAIVKTPASILKKAIAQPIVMASLLDAAKGMSMDNDYPGEASSRAVKARWGIRVLSQILEQGIGQELIKNVRKAMISEDDVIRARVDFAHPEVLNRSLKTVRAILGAYSPEARRVLNGKLRGELFATMDTTNVSKAFIFPIEEREDKYGYDPKDPAGWMINWIRHLPKPCALYIATHTYWPVSFALGQLKFQDARAVTTSGRAELLGCEIQFGMRQTRPANNLSRPFWDRQAKTGRPVRLPEELIGAVQEKVLEDLLRVFHPN